MECHFNWQLDCSESSLQKLQRDLEDRLRCGCRWMRNVYNDLGYVLHVQGSKDEALENLIKGQRYPINTDTEDQLDGPRLVNQANMAWVYYRKGELEKSRACLEEVARLQEEFPTPEGSQIHPVLSAQKGWTLMRYENSHKRRAIECFKMALAAGPEKKNYHKGLALAMEKSYKKEDFKRNPELQREMIDQLKVARDMYKNEDVCLGALYLINSLAPGDKCEEAAEEANELADKLIASGDISGLSNLLYLLMARLTNNDKAIEVTEKMLEKFPQSTRVKKNLANCLKRKAFSFPMESEERLPFIKRSEDLYEEMNARESVRGRIDLASLKACAGDYDAAEHQYKSLLEEQLTDAEKQLVLRRYGDHMFHVKCPQNSSEMVELYMRAVQIPVASEHRDTCIKRLAHIVRYGSHERCEEICSFLLNLLCESCRDIGELFLRK